LEDHSAVSCSNQVWKER